MIEGGQKDWRLWLEYFSGFFWRMQSCAGKLITIDFPMICLYFLLPTGLEILQIKVFLVVFSHILCENPSSKKNNVHEIYNHKRLHLKSDQSLGMFDSFWDLGKSQCLSILLLNLK